MWQHNFNRFIDCNAPGEEWRKSDEEVMTMIEEELDMLQTIRERQWKWIGHMQRVYLLLSTVVNGKAKGSRRRGSTRLMRLDWIMTGEYESSKKRSNRVRRGDVGYQICLCEENM